VGAIPDSVKRLIADHVESVSQLEVLLLLQAGGDELWAPDGVARRLKTAPEIADAALSKFARAGIAAVEVDASGEPRFAYRPASPAMKNAVDTLAARYATHKTTVIALIFEQPSDAIQDFADAFRLRGEDG
jgi:hypothetical protein